MPTQNYKITSTKSVSFWKQLKNKIKIDMSNNDLWDEAFSLFQERIDSRYLDHANILIDNGKNTGEGFAIMTIYCSLVEFLETTHRGINFRECPREELNEHEYGLGESKKLFTSFFGRTPFNIDEEQAKNFYKHVRCALLHEAQTSPGWKIRVDGAKLIEEMDGFKVVDRTIFRKKMDQYISLYKEELFASDDIKNAFIRKFDGICGLS